MVLLGTVTFNRIMNPYSVFDGPLLDGINVKKPAFQDHLRMAKAMEVRRIKPTAISLGTSRKERGIDPNHSGWSEDITYNLGLSSSTLYEAYRYMQHANTIQPLNKVVLMLDFIMFDASKERSIAEFNEERLMVSSEGKKLGADWTDTLLSLFTLDALIDSVEVLLGQDGPQKYLKNGMHNPVYEEINYVLQHRKSFDMINKGYVPKYDKWVLSTNKLDNLDVYQKILSYAHENNIELFIGVSPIHAELLEVIFDTGKWKLFEQWKVHLVNFNEKVAKKYNKESHQLMDFSDYNLFTTESVPLEDDYSTKMKWYWESSHYKKELGDIVLCRLFNNKSSECLDIPNFGVELSTETINSHLNTIRLNRERWISSFPTNKDKINKFVK